MINYTLIGWTAICIVSMLLVIRFWKVGIVSNSIPVKRLEYYYKRFALRRKFKKAESMLMWHTFGLSFFDMAGARKLGIRQYGCLVEQHFSEHKWLNAQYQAYFSERLDIASPVT